MTGPGTWTLLLNGTPIATNSFQLNAGASTQCQHLGLFGTLELDTSGGGAAPGHRLDLLPVADRHADPRPRPPSQLSASCTPDAQGTVHHHQHRQQHDRPGHLDPAAERHAHCDQLFPAECRARPPISTPRACSARWSWIPQVAGPRRQPFPLSASRRPPRPPPRRKHARVTEVESRRKRYIIQFIADCLGNLRR